ncbi:MAG: hypothetical protein ABIX12_15605 [Rubrivivax sp.]
MEELEQETLVAVACDEGAALVTHDDLLGHQLADGPAQGLAAGRGERVIGSG